MGRYRRAAFHGARRQNWATPWPLFREIERRYGWGGYTVDVAAESWSSKCATWISEDVDALSPGTPWGAVHAPSRAWLNPPFDNIEPFMRRALEEVALGRCELVTVLVPSRTGQRWFVEIARPFGRIVELLGRVAFDPPADYDGDATGGFEDCILVHLERPLDATRFRGAP